jgi:hypothetical protein
MRLEYDGAYAIVYICRFCSTTLTIPPRAQPKLRMVSKT